jgi:hypothetical protein
MTERCEADDIITFANVDVKFMAQQTIIQPTRNHFHLPVEKDTQWLNLIRRFLRYLKPCASGNVIV